MIYFSVLFLISGLENSLFRIGRSPSSIDVLYGMHSREWIQVYFNQMKCVHEGSEQSDRVDGVITVLRPKVKSNRLNLVLKLRGEELGRMKQRKED